MTLLGDLLDRNYQAARASRPHQPQEARKHESHTTDRSGFSEGESDEGGLNQGESNGDDLSQGDNGHDNSSQGDSDEDDLAGGESGTENIRDENSDSDISEEDGEEDSDGHDSMYTFISGRSRTTSMQARFANSLYFLPAPDSPSSLTAPAGMFANQGNRKHRAKANLQKPGKAHGSATHNVGRGESGPNAAIFTTAISPALDLSVIKDIQLSIEEICCVSVTDMLNAEFQRC